MSVMEFCEEVSKYRRAWESVSVLGRMNSYEGQYSFKMDFLNQWAWKVRKFFMTGFALPELPVAMSLPCSHLSLSLSNFVFSFVICCVLLCYCIFLMLANDLFFSSSPLSFLSHHFHYLDSSSFALALFLIYFSPLLIWFCYFEESEHE